jgi:hypothetical protein
MDIGDVITGCTEFKDLGFIFINSFITFENTAVMFENLKLVILT